MMLASPDGFVAHSLAPDRRLLGNRNRVMRSHDAEVTGLEFPPHLIGEQHHTVIDLGKVKRVAMMVTPEGGGSFRDEAWEAASTIRAILRQQDEPMAVTMQTVFVRDRADVPVARQILEACYGGQMPVTLFVVQPPCEGRGLAIEAWAVNTNAAQVEYHSEDLVTVSYDGLRWIYASGGSLHLEGRTPYEQSAEAFSSMRRVLARAGAGFQDVVRTWLYQGCITEEVDGVERYRELNRARTDFFTGIDFEHRPVKVATQRPRHLSGQHRHRHALPWTGHGLHGLADGSRGCAAHGAGESAANLRLRLSEGSIPSRVRKFARAMAVRAGEYVTTWISGTASIVNAETVHKGDIVKQTEQTLTNIEKLIAPENFARQGWADAGATFEDLARLHVYVKRPEDYEACRAVCERRVGHVPSIYAVADVCRPDLLVEIEGVAFSRLSKPQSQLRTN
jgi:enamine deaminase RidA (YjgF/YER057c/UK114 family)